jgi:hypothetical protein
LLQRLNTQVEAALQSGLNFKDRFRTNSRKRLLLVPADPDPVEQGEQPLDEVADLCDGHRAYAQQYTYSTFCSLVRVCAEQSMSCKL